MEKGVNVKISETAFEGLTQFNGQNGKTTGEKGASGKTEGVALPSGGLVFVEPENLEVIY